MARNFRLDSPPRLTKRIERVGPWIVFCAILLWGWPVRDLFHDVPIAIGDPSEVLWGIRWYYEALFVRHISPLYTPLMFFPNGWHTATLAHTPLHFLMALPLYAAGGLAFAYNSLILFSFVVAYAGSLRLARLYVSPFVAMTVALVFTFTPMRWIRLGGHLHVLWGTSLLPWLLWSLETMRRSSPEQTNRKIIVLAGVQWGMMINFLLYGIFLGAVPLVIFGKQLFSAARIKQIVAIVVIALAVSMPTIALFAAGSQADAMDSVGIEDVQLWGASLNSLFIPSFWHRVEFVRQFAHTIYPGPYDESGASTLGLVTFILGAVGTVFVVRSQRAFSPLIAVAAVGLILALGVTLRWSGVTISHPIFRPVNDVIWGIGHLLKPTKFTSPIAPSPYADGGIPLPGFLLTAVIPFWETARVASRYAAVGGLALMMLGAIGLTRLPRVLRYALAVLWIFETLPLPSSNPVPIPTVPHPAQTWVAQQHLLPNEAVLDIASGSIMLSGEIVYSSQFYETPSAAGTGSFFPKSTAFLNGFVRTNILSPSADSSSLSEIIQTMHQYGVRYILLHITQDADRDAWNRISGNGALRPVKCFDPGEDPTLWKYPICVAEVAPVPNIKLNAALRTGFSGLEKWGVWAEGSVSEAAWVATAKQEYRLSMETFPNCVKSQHQTITIEVNDMPVGAYQWQECEVWRQTLTIPASIVQIGWNRIVIRYAYAMPPSGDDRSTAGDERKLSVGFTEFSINQEGNP